MSTAVPSPPIFLPDVACNFPEQPSLAHIKRAALLKHLAVSERLAEVRTAARLEVRPRPEMISSGVTEVDALTGGGIPRGCLTEIWGAASSGKTSLLLATIAAATGRREACVLMDGSDSFDPESGQAAGIDFGKLLWVRCGKGSGIRLQASGFMFQEKGKNQARRAEHRLDQVLKATDLILQSGGFGLIVLDLAGIEEKFVRRIPLASWFRFQRAVEHTRSALLVASESSCAQTCAALSLKMEQPSAFSFQFSAKPARAELLEKIPVQAEVTRSRLDRKPVQSAARFETQAVRFG
jgi:hypothetical protein